MRFYTVHERESGPPASRLILLREGFSWGAFLLGPLWALWHGMLLVMLGLLVLALLLIVGLDATGLDGNGALAAQLGLNLLVGLTGNDLRRWSLGRNGWHMAGLVSGIDQDSALRRFLDREPALAHRLVS